MELYGKKYCDGINRGCGNLLYTDESISKNLCMFCLGFHKEPLGPVNMPFSKYRWVK